MSEAGWCCALDDGNGLWYTDKYPEEMFFEHWATMAKRYAANPMVIGADLRNEVRVGMGRIVDLEKTEFLNICFLALMGGFRISEA